MTGVVTAAEELDFELAPIRNFGRGADIGCVEEIRCVDPGVPAVHPSEQGNRLRAVVRLRNGQLIRLNGTVERRIVSKRHRTLLRRPGRLSRLQLPGALNTPVEYGERISDVVLSGHVFRKFEHPVRGLRMHVDVGHQVILAALGLDRLDQRVQLVELGLNLVAIGCAQLKSGSAAACCACGSTRHRSGPRRDGRCDRLLLSEKGKQPRKDGGGHRKDRERFHVRLLSCRRVKPEYTPKLLEN